MKLMRNKKSYSYVVVVVVTVVTSLSTCLVSM